MRCQNTATFVTTLAAFSVISSKPVQSNAQAAISPRSPLSSNYLNEAKPGVLMVLRRIKDPSLSEENFNKFVDARIPDLIKSGLFDIAIRYKNVNPSAAWPYLNVERLPDVAQLNNISLTANLPNIESPVPGQNIANVLLSMGMDDRAYTLVQRFEGQVPKKGVRGKALATVLIEPATGDEADLDEWVRKQHYDMLSMVPGYRRTTRYQLAPQVMVPAVGKPRFLALHEWDTTDIPIDRIMLTLNTEWSKRILGAAKIFELEMWEEMAGAAYGLEEKL